MSRNIERKNIAEVGPKEEERNEEAKVDQIASELGIDLVTLAKSDEKEFAKAYEEVFKEYVERLKTEPLKAQKAAVRWWVKKGDGFNVMILLGRFGFPGKEDIKTMAGGEIVIKHDGVATQESSGGRGEITPEQQEAIINSLAKQLNPERQILTDEELVEITRQTAREVGLKRDIFDQAENWPKIFYRAFRPTEVILKWLKQEENIQRPFSYAMPGMISEMPERSTDLPLPYGGKTPVLIRIIDTGGYWEDTAAYWFGEEPGGWIEAMNLDPVVLRKIDKRTLSEIEARAQVGAPGGGEIPIQQDTFIVDKIKTEQLKRDPNKLEIFVEDTGFWRELSERAKNFNLNMSNTKYGNKLNRKYVEYFDSTVRLDEAKAGTEEAKQAIINTKTEILAMVKRLKSAEDDPQWTQLIHEVMGGFSSEFWQEYSKIEKELIL